MTLRQQLVGNCFVSPTMEYLLIGSVWSIALALVLLSPQAFSILDSGVFLGLFIAVNFAHFAASTIRLYDKPEFRAGYPFLANVFPVITFAVLLACIAWSQLGNHLFSLYLTWSPYHYAAQAYGLSVMYLARSGIRYEKPGQRLIFWICLAPFFLTILKSGLQPTNAGLPWLLPAEFLARPAVSGFLEMSTRLLAVLTFLLPAAWYAWQTVVQRRAIPLMPLLIIGTNGLWWVGLDYLEAFTWATVAHGLQYLAIMLIFHVRERTRDPSNRRPGWQHAAIFYGQCVVLGYLLFLAWPYAFQYLGASYAQSALVCIAVINIHHFIVDRYIWRLRGTSNAGVVREGAPAAAGPMPAGQPG